MNCPRCGNLMIPNVEHLVMKGNTIEVVTKGYVCIVCGYVTTETSIKPSTKKTILLHSHKRKMLF